jgi:predicted O-methyltransferase YrrM
MVGALRLISIGAVPKMSIMFKRIYWRLREKLKRARTRSRPPSSEFHFQVSKRSEATWPFEPVLDLFASERLTQAAKYQEKIERIRNKMIAYLQGAAERTHFRHQEVLMDAGECAELVSSPQLGGRLVYELVKIFRPMSVVEIGSAFGVGSMYIVEALRQNGRGSFVGIEYEEWRADIANENLRVNWPNQGSVRSGRAEDILPQLLAGGRRIDFAFIDAVHKYEDTLGYHRLLEKGISNEAILIYDDINWSEDMRRFWQDLIVEDAVSDALLINERWGIVRHSGHPKGDTH